MTFYIKQNDTSPAMLATLQDASGSAVNVTGGSVRFHMRPVGSTTAKVSTTATIVNASTGSVRYSWASGDTDTVGAYQAEFQVTYSDGKIESFPNDGYIAVEITDDIA